ncbi:MAG TPA: hypothetical protein VF615_09790 [Longimicrobiaceae bacterium]|jgi:hypothetical protein
MAEIPPALLQAFPPAPDALLHLLRARMDDGMLREIARADYGMDEDEHLVALLPIRDRGEVPPAMGWEPREVLELIRWSEPEDPEWKPGSTGARGHLMRAFACAALLRAAAEPGQTGRHSGENSTVAQLLASALALGPDVQEAAARFLAWRTPRLEPEEERPFFAFGLLVLAALLREGRMDDEALAAAADWVVAEEAEERAALHPLPANPDGWLLGLTRHDLRDTVWRALAERLGREAEAMPPGPARGRLLEVALRVM